MANAEKKMMRIATTRSARRGRRHVLMLIALRASSSTATSEQSCAASDAPLPFKLTHKWQQSPDSWLLRYALPPGKKWLGDDHFVPTCVKVLFADGTDAKTGEPKPLEKSYSPVSHPQVEGFFDLIVKGYPPRHGGGVGSYLCDMKVGDTVLGTLKSKRDMHGGAAVLGRWQNIGLVAGGTGIAPLLQIARIVLESSDEAARSTMVHLLSINRRHEDILARDLIEELRTQHPQRFKVAYSLTQPPAQGWEGFTGRGSRSMVEAALPRPTNDSKTMVLVCGTDGFVSTWGGPIGRAPSGPDGKKGAKVQGPLRGLLAEAGFDESEVFKY